MRCPQCDRDFAFSLRLYFKTPWGRFSCPLCGTALVGKHHWWYWPAIVTGCLILAIPAGYLASRYVGAFGWAVGGFVGGLLSGVPCDYYLESCFSILEARGPAPSKD
jgi:hypothetical protein